MDLIKLKNGYREMSEDLEHESLALEWSEALIGDIPLDNAEEQDRC